MTPKAPTAIIRPRMQYITEALAFKNKKRTSDMQDSLWMGNPDHRAGRVCGFLEGVSSPVLTWVCWSASVRAVETSGLGREGGNRFSDRNTRSGVGAFRWFDEDRRQGETLPCRHSSVLPS